MLVLFLVVLVGMGRLMNNGQGLFHVMQGLSQFSFGNRLGYLFPGIQSRHATTLWLVLRLVVVLVVGGSAPPPKRSSSMLLLLWFGSSGCCGCDGTRGGGSIATRGLLVQPIQGLFITGLQVQLFG